jgi:hypothetical protein
MTYLESAQIVARVVAEVAGTIQTCGIQQLSHEERSGMSDYLYVRNCLISTAYNACRSFPGFNLSRNEFFQDVNIAVAAREEEYARLSKAEDLMCAAVL